MNDRRAQWLRFYEAALGGACADINAEERDIAAWAGRVADAAMAQADARTYRPNKSDALIEAATAVWSASELKGKVCTTPEQHMEWLGKALAALEEDNPSGETE